MTTFTKSEIQSTTGSWIDSAVTWNYNPSRKKVSAVLKRFDGSGNSDYFYMPLGLTERLHNIDGNFVSLGHIPQTIYQTYSSQEKINTSKPDLKKAQKSWIKKATETGFSYRFYNDQDIDLFMFENFSNPTGPFGGKLYKLYAYLGNTPGEFPPVMKADIWRYAIIYIYGGIYADLDTTCNTDPRIFLKNSVDIVCVPENDVHLCQWVFSAPKKSPAIAAVIYACISKYENSGNAIIKNPHYIHEYTGPAAFTRGIEKYLDYIKSPTVNKKTEYSKLNSRSMFCFDANIFHRTQVIHHFNGQSKDGWTKQVSY